jgi:D-alanyl-D-alanine carboxypeptidase (penicillin-binding protein 5/6)
MNARAKALGMNSTRFHNPHGLPESSSRADNVSSAEDMAILAEHILEYKPLMECAATKRADFRPVGSKGHLDLSNHNHLLESCAGVDGLKTGFINRSGFCITITCKRGDRRMVAVLMGVPNRKDRDKFASQLLDWGYRRAENPSAVDEAPRNPSPRRRRPPRRASRPRRARRPARKSRPRRPRPPRRSVPAKRSVAKADGLDLPTPGSILSNLS